MCFSVINAGSPTYCPVPSMASTTAWWLSTTVSSQLAVSAPVATAAGQLDVQIHLLHRHPHGLAQAATSITTVRRSVAAAGTDLPPRHARDEVPEP